MPHVMIGNIRTTVNWLEYYFAILPKGTPVEWRPWKSKMSGRPPVEPGCGWFTFSWHYDGIIGEIDADRKRVAIHASVDRKRYRVRRLRDVRRLVGQGMHGDGI